MRPFCDEEVNFVGGICNLVSPFGPMFSYQDWSVEWVAVFCESFRCVFDSVRWIRGLK